MGVLQGDVSTNAGVYGARFVIVCRSLSGYSTENFQGGWNDIVPLHSTRRDVEGRLGEPTGECHCAYATPTKQSRSTTQKVLVRGHPTVGT